MDNLTGTGIKDIDTSRPMAPTRAKLGHKAKILT